MKQIKAPAAAAPSFSSIPSLFILINSSTKRASLSLLDSLNRSHRCRTARAVDQNEQTSGTTCAVPKVRERDQFGPTLTSNETLTTSPLPPDPFDCCTSHRQSSQLY